MQFDFRKAFDGKIDNLKIKYIYGISTLNKMQEKAVKILFLNSRSVNVEKYWAIKFQIEHLLHNICVL